MIFQVEAILVACVRSGQPASEFLPPTPLPTMGARPVATTIFNMVRDSSPAARPHTASTCLSPSTPSCHLALLSCRPLCINTGESLFALPLFSNMSRSPAIPPYLHPTQSTCRHASPRPSWTTSSQRHVASSQLAPSSSFSSGPRPRHTSSQVRSSPEPKPEHGHGHKHKHVEEQEDLPPHSPFLSILLSLVLHAKYIIIRCTVFHVI